MASFLEPYQLEEIAPAVRGWDDVINDNLQILSDSIAAPRYRATMGENAGQFYAVYLHTDSKFYKALATAWVTMPAVGLLLAAGTGGSPATAQLSGLVTGMAGLTPGAIYYVDDSAAGGIVVQKPDVGIVQVMGKALTSTTLWLAPRLQERGVSSLQFMLKEIAASQTNQPLPLMNDTDFVEAVVPWDGSVVAVGANANGGVAAGTMTIELLINGGATGLTTVLNNGNQRNSTVQVEGLDTFSAGDYLSVRYTTDGAWLPDGSLDVVVTAWFSTIGAT